MQTHSLDALSKQLVSGAGWNTDRCITRIIPAAEPRYGELDSPLSPRIQHILNSQNIHRLFSHQAEAINAFRKGKNLLLATPTASGKSLAFQIPTLELIEENPDASAIYLFPFKALARDQAKSLETFFHYFQSGTGREPVNVYDGDTPKSRRSIIRRDPPHVLITNPDMIHYSLLPYHTKWHKLLENIRLIVLDEIHVYRGVFGSHVLQTLRRLKRILEHYGARPQFITCSATIGNPGRLAEHLLEEPFHVITDSGSPRQEKGFLSHFPETQASSAAVRVFDACLKRGLKTIVFTKSRRATELVYRYLKERNPAAVSRVSVYRAGFLAADRREIENKLFNNELDGVISTSALELGIDIGGLDCCILIGFPGSVASLFQRAGRVGRNAQLSLVVYIVGEDALDRFWYEHEARLHEVVMENVVVYKDNNLITDQHLECAADELIIEPGKNYPMDEHVQTRIKSLTGRGVLLESAGGGQFLSRTHNPQRQVTIRSMGDRFDIVSDSKGVIGTVDGIRVFKECHTGAIYLHGGEVYRVVELDLGNYKVRVEKGPEDIYTQSFSDKETDILSVEGEYNIPNGRVCYGSLRVRERVSGYKIKRIYTSEIVARHPLESPEMEFETRGIWIMFNSDVIEYIDNSGFHPMGGLHGLEHALIGLYPIISICDRSDLAGISTRMHTQTGHASVFVYDGYPGGLGLAESALKSFDRLITETLSHIGACECESGCPYCIQSPKCGSGNEPLDKNATILLLESISGGKEFIMSQKISRPEQSFQIPELPPESECPPGHHLVFDIETRLSADEVGGWKHADRMRIAITVIYDIELERYEFYEEEHSERLLKRLQEAGEVIGFNSENFDFAVLSGYCDGRFTHSGSVDLLQHAKKYLGHRLSLQQIASVTVGASKSADGLQSLQWWKEGRLDLIAEYCQKDVEITWQVYQYGIDNGFVLYKHRSGIDARISVDW